MGAFDRILLMIDVALDEATDAFEVDRLVAARQCLSDESVPTLGASTRRRASRRAFAKWCPGCRRARPGSSFNRNRRKRDGLQDVCRVCQRRLYQEHVGAIARADIGDLIARSSIGKGLRRIRERGIGDELAILDKGPRRRRASP